MISARSCHQAISGLEQRRPELDRQRPAKSSGPRDICASGLITRIAAKIDSYFPLPRENASKVSAIDSDLARKITNSLFGGTIPKGLQYLGPPFLSSLFNAIKLGYCRSKPDD